MQFLVESLGEGDVRCAGRVAVGIAKEDRTQVEWLLACGSRDEASRLSERDGNVLATTGRRLGVKDEVVGLCERDICGRLGGRVGVKGWDRERLARSDGCA